MKNQSQCHKCVMDGSAKEITFDEEGVCNFCRQAEKSIKEISLLPAFLELSEKIKEAGRGKQYDIVIGLSGGVDSSTALDLCVYSGLRPFCFSIDNGWNDPIADENIMKLVEGLKVPFFRYVIDLDRFKELQAAFFKSGVINIEIPSDHIIVATAYEMAKRYGIKYIVSGGNVVSESIMPFSWSYPARDLKHIRAIYKKFTGKKFEGLPMMSLLKFNYYKWIKKIEVINILDYFNYNLNESKIHLASKFGWKSYGEKHEESIFTKWFQNFYLFTKFSIDKRKAHYSSLINSGQMTRQEALLKLEASPVYPKFGIEAQVMKYPKHDHFDYATDYKLFNFISKVVKKLR